MIRKKQWSLAHIGCITIKRHPGAFPGNKEKKRDEKKRPDEKAENRKEADVHRASSQTAVDHPDIGIRPDTWIEKRVRNRSGY